MQNLFKYRLRPLDFIIFACLLVFSIYSIKNSTTAAGEKILVTADDKKYEYSLSQDGIFSVQGAEGLTTFEIKEKKVRIIDSACPNKTCVHQGWTSPLVCLPNRVIITVENPGDFAAVTQ